jgi:hypothetical protein
MVGKMRWGGIFLAAVALTAAAEDPQGRAKLSAAQIVEKNVAARGGLQAWRAVQALSMMGKMDAGGNNRPTLPMPGRKTGRQMPTPRPAEQIQLPFVMELKRPRKVRVELQFNGQTALQVFDGANGWKVRPFLNRREVEPFTAEEMKATSMQAELDGYLVDYAAKGTNVELAGVEKIDGRDAYKLELALKNGEKTHVWIDAATFLEVKIEGVPRRMDGKYRPVAIYFRDFRAVNGLLFPFLLETKVEYTGYGPAGNNLQIIAEKIVIEKVAVNPKLEDSLFSRPQIEAASNARQEPATGGQPLK